MTGCRGHASTALAIHLDHRARYRPALLVVVEGGTDAGVALGKIVMEVRDVDDIAPGPVPRHLRCAHHDLPVELRRKVAARGSARSDAGSETLGLLLAVH